jgi:hypothetical protein
MCTYSCASEEEPEVTEEVETIDESLEEIDVDELPEAISKDIQQDEINLDSVQSLYKEMEQFYLDQQGQLEDAKSQFHLLSYTTFDVYSNGSEQWYFDQNFNLLFYKKDFGAEGGYSEYAFARFKKDLIWILYSQTSDMDYPTNIFERYNDSGRLESIAGMKKDYYSEDEKETFFIPEEVNIENYYTDIIGKHKSELYKAGAKYIYEKSEMVDSEYGGQEASGYHISIDSLLFLHLY